MKNKTFLSLPLFVASVMAFSNAAYAHGLHEVDAEPKAKASTCKHLADPGHYTVDLKDPATKALKARCDAGDKPAASVTEKKADTPDKK